MRPSLPRPPLDLLLLGGPSRLGPPSCTRHSMTWGSLSVYCLAICQYGTVRYRARPCDTVLHDTLKQATEEVSRAQTERMRHAGKSHNSRQVHRQTPEEQEARKRGKQAEATTRAPRPLTKPASGVLWLLVSGSPPQPCCLLVRVQLDALLPGGASGPLACCCRRCSAMETSSSNNSRYVEPQQHQHPHVRTVFL
jgi:hypothetical protein